MPAIIRHKLTGEYVTRGNRWGVWTTPNPAKARIFKGTGPAKNSVRRYCSPSDFDIVELPHPVADTYKRALEAILVFCDYAEPAEAIRKIAKEALTLPDTSV